jgi:gamma-glutamyltranspeptidase
MDRGEVATLLAMVSSLDRQAVDDGMVEMWHRLLGEYSFTDCEAALLPAYKDSRNGFITAKSIYDRVALGESGPGKRVWVRALHDEGQHFACEPGEFGCR